MYKTIQYESGHSLIDNNHGDYDFHCPSVGKVAFVNPAQVHRIERICCAKCGVDVGSKVSEASPYDLTSGAGNPIRQFLDAVNRA